MNLFRRLFSIGKAEAHSAVDKLEDPIKMTEQGIRDLKGDLDKAVTALAEIKALSIRARNDIESITSKAEDYEQKAILILQRGQKGEMDASEADRLASEALVKKEENIKHSARSKVEKEKFDVVFSKYFKKCRSLAGYISERKLRFRDIRKIVKLYNECD